MGNFVRTGFARRLQTVFGAAFLLLVAATAALAQQSVTATWDRNQDSVTAGYRLYYGTSPGTYQWSVDAGSQTSAPLNLSPGNYYFVVRGYNASYEQGPASIESQFSAGATATPTAAIQATLQSSTSALVSWQSTNAVAATLNGVSVAVNGSTTVAVSSTTTFTIVARSSTGATATASATVTVVPPGGTTAPLNPTNLAASVSRSRVTLSWQRNPSGGVPTEYLLDIGTSSGGSNVLAAQSVGNVLTVGGDLPRGTYFGRVRARNASGTSSSSNEVTFRVSKSRLASPTGFTATWQGTTATLTWAPSAADSPDMTPITYVLEAGSAPGKADIATMSLGSTTSFSANIPSGVYYVRVRAENDNGDSDWTRDIVLAAPGTAQAPRTLSAGGTASTVTLSWAPPAGGEAPAGYVIDAGSDPGLSDLASIRVGNVTQFSTEAPPGTYFVRVRAVTSRGPGLPSNEVVVQK